jgi:hypothetical protein
MMLSKKILAAKQEEDQTKQKCLAAIDWLLANALTTSNSYLNHI